MDTIIAYLIPVASPAILIALLLLFHPEKIEKLSALLWRLLAHLPTLFRSAHKKYLKHDLQGRVNDYAKRLSKKVPFAAQQRLRIDWVDSSDTRESFIENGQVILRLRREDPSELNFVHGAYHYVSRVLLATPKRYLSPPQRDAVDLFVSAKLFEQEKESVVGLFLDEYLHPATVSAKSKVSMYLGDFAEIERRGLFFPVFLQELYFLGKKVFGRPRNDLIIGEVNDFITFLRRISLRTVGEDSDLTFDGKYCKTALVIIGKRWKLNESIAPYCSYIRGALLDNDFETIYLLSREQNRILLERVADTFDVSYSCARKHSFLGELRYAEGLEAAEQFLLVMKRRDLPLIQPASRSVTER